MQRKRVREGLDRTKERSIILPRWRVMAGESGWASPLGLEDDGWRKPNIRKTSGPRFF